MLKESGTAPAKIICMNSGVFLTTGGSPVLEIMKAFEETGVEILSCSTCLEYYQRQDKLMVGQSTNMKDTVDDMLNFKKVITI